MNRSLAVKEKAGQNVGGRIRSRCVLRFSRYFEREILLKTLTLREIYAYFAKHMIRLKYMRNLPERYLFSLNCARNFGRHMF